MSGDQLTSTAKQLGLSTRVIMLTGFGAFMKQGQRRRDDGRATDDF